MKTFHVDYEIIPMRGILTDVIDAPDAIIATETLTARAPHCRVLKVTQISEIYSERIEELLAMRGKHSELSGDDFTDALQLIEYLQSEAIKAHIALLGLSHGHCAPCFCGPELSEHSAACKLARDVLKVE